MRGPTLWGRISLPPAFQDLLCPQLEGMLGMMGWRDGACVHGRGNETERAREHLLHAGTV